MIKSINNQYKDLNWNAYTGLFIVFITFAFGNFLVPSLHTILSSKNCLLLSNLIQIILFCDFIYPIKYTFTLISICIGICQSILWVTNITFLIENSDNQKKIIDRNIYLFWYVSYYL